MDRFPPWHIDQGLTVWRGRPTKAASRDDGDGDDGGDDDVEGDDHDGGGDDDYDDGDGDGAAGYGGGYDFLPSA